MYDRGLSWPWSYGSWIYNYLCNQCLSPLMLWVRISIRARCTTLCDKVCQWLATGWWFSPGTPVSSTNKTDHHDITEILLKVVLNTIKQTNKHTWISKLPFWFRFHISVRYCLLQLSKCKPVSNIRVNTHVNHCRWIIYQIISDFIPKIDNFAKRDFILKIPHFYFLIDNDFYYSSQLLWV